MKLKNLARLELASVKAVLLPMIVLWMIAVAGVALYYGSAWFSAMLEPLRRFQGEHAIAAPFLSQMFFCGLLPGVFILALKSLRPRHPVATMLAQGLWCGVSGVICNGFFLALGAVFGDGADITTLCVKTAISQFIWTPLFIAPANAVFFFWLGRDFSLARSRAEFPHRFYRDAVMPNLVANWLVWIPVTLAVFAFPIELQIHINGLAGAFWMLMCLEIGRRTRESLLPECSEYTLLDCSDT